MSKNFNYNIDWRIEKDLIKYEDAINFMEKRVRDIYDNKAQQLIWILEHYPVYTAGISAKDEDLLNKNGIPIFKTNRGGKYTYHCPKMKIIYLMLDLKKLFLRTPPDITKFVKFLENWIIAVLKNYRINGQIKDGRVGIWVDTPSGEKKISAIGIKVKKWITYHGIALNIAPDLKGFDNIVPCGIKEFGITSFKDLGIENYDEIKFLEILQNEFYNNLKFLSISGS